MIFERCRGWARCAWVAIACAAGLPGRAEPVPAGGLVLPGPTAPVRIRLHADPSPDAPGLFNTLDLDANGVALLRAPGGIGLAKWRASPADAEMPHSILVDGTGPIGDGAEPTVAARASGPGWSYAEVDLGGSYGPRLESYHRGVLFVEPGLFVIHDHAVPRVPSRFSMRVAAPVPARVDAAWGDLRLDLPGAGFTIQSPAPRRQTWVWERLPRPARPAFPESQTFALSPTNRLAILDWITVIAVSPGGAARDVASKYLESNTAVGVRVHRDGLPTLVAFRTAANGVPASLTGFGFEGPVGVSVFRPKVRKP